MEEIRLPKELKIGAHNVEVVFPYKFTERYDINGDYAKAISQIRVALYDSENNKRTESEVWVTLFHEILHAIDFSSGQRMFSGEEGENRIEAISEGLYQVMNDNKLLNKP